MAYFNITNISRSTFWDSAIDFFHNLGNSIDLAASSNSRMRQMEQLNALSDAELTAKGLRREDIARHVFRDILNV
jgi:hypothetical protein